MDGTTLLGVLLSLGLGAWCIDYLRHGGKAASTTDLEDQS